MKKLITILLAIVMTISCSFSVFAAENNEMEYSEVEKLINNAEAIAEKQNIDLNQDQAYLKKVINLEEGVTLTIELYDLDENEEISDVITEAKAASAENGDTISVPSGSMETMDYIPYRTIYKNYGNRYFTTKYTYGYPSGSVTILTENHYSIGDYGLKARKGVCVCKHEGIFSDKKARWDITDRTATAVGNDINIEGLVEYTVGGAGGFSSGPRHMKLDTRVRLDKLDKANKRAQVTEHAYFSRTKTLL